MQQEVTLVARFVTNRTTLRVKVLHKVQFDMQRTIKVQVKLCNIQKDTEWEWRYSSTLPLTRTQGGEGRSMPRPGRFPVSLKSPDTHCGKVGCVGFGTGRMGAGNFVSTWIRTRNPVASTELLYRILYTGQCYSTQVAVNHRITKLIPCFQRPE